MLDVGQIGLAVAPPAICEQTEKDDEEDDDWSESSLIVVKWGDRYIQNARPIRARAKSLSPSQVS